MCLIRTLSESKFTSRRKFKQARKLSVAIARANAEAVARHAFCSALVLRFHSFAAYLSDNGELDTQPLLTRLARTGKHLQLPCIISDWRGRHMQFHGYRLGDALQRNIFGLPQPANLVNPAVAGPDVLLLPLVAFDTNGARLGMGGGFYDRYGAAHPHQLRIGLAHEVQRSAGPLPTDAWDVPLDAVITEVGWQFFSRRAHCLLNLNCG